jgi:UDP-glucuronate decarboxylase
MAVDDGRVVSNFIAQALNGRDLTVYGDGTQTRSFQYIADLTDGLILMMNQDKFIGPVNMGNPDEITIKQLAQKIIELTGSDSKISYNNLPQDDPIRRQPDITLAKQKLGWQPVIDLEDGLRKTINR